LIIVDLHVFYNGDLANVAMSYYYQESQQLDGQNFPIGPSSEGRSSCSVPVRPTEILVGKQQSCMRIMCASEIRPLGRVTRTHIRRIVMFRISRREVLQVVRRAVPLSSCWQSDRISSRTSDHGSGACLPLLARGRVVQLLPGLGSMGEIMQAPESLTGRVGLAKLYSHGTVGFDKGEAHYFQRANALTCSSRRRNQWAAIWQSHRTRIINGDSNKGGG
jgi:hypothetical protein